MREIVEAQDVVQLVARAGNSLPEADYANAMLLKVAQGDGLEAAVECGQFAGDGLVNAVLEQRHESLGSSANQFASTYCCSTAAATFLPVRTTATGPISGRPSRSAATPTAAEPSTRTCSLSISQRMASAIWRSSTSTTSLTWRCKSSSVMLPCSTLPA